MVSHRTLLCLIGILTYLIYLTAANEAIIGAQLASPNQFPYQVSIQYRINEHACGGGIIADQFILTAGHCVLSPNGNHFNHSIKIIAGTIDLNNTNPPAIIAHVEKIYIPAEYNIKHLSTTGDIAVLKLREPINLAQHRLTRVRLPINQQDDYVGRIAFLAGFGHCVPHTVMGAFKSSDRLRFSETDIIDSETCQTAYAVQRISGKHICARIKQSNDLSIRGACVGDSGGLLVLPDHIAVGVLSRGPVGGSERIKPSVYTRISHFLTFIHNAKTNKITKNMVTFDVPL